MFSFGTILLEERSHAGHFGIVLGTQLAPCERTDHINAEVLSGGGAIKPGEAATGVRWYRGVKYLDSITHECGNIPLTPETAICE